ncbi:unnamed protein product [marine sediment metagenome]|uniref:Uncharacterized protein n=1 Tax=marine sediment metagenome TaxID=412755 RepID=X1BKH4_9ZZZZ
MDKREVVKLAIERRKVPYVPWHCGFTVEAAEKLQKHFGRDDLDRVLDNHFVKLGSDIGFFTALGNERFRDVFGVVWDRRVDKDIGIVEGQIEISSSVFFDKPVKRTSSPKRLISTLYKPTASVNSAIGGFIPTPPCAPSIFGVI